MPPFIEIRDLHYCYQREGSDSVRAVQGVSLALHPGEFVVLVGANGSGKTTLLARHLNAVLSPTRGEVRVAGPVTCDPSNWPATRSQVAIIFQRPEDQMLWAGQQQKLAIAGDLAMRPRCLVLDEATAMWDPAGRRDLLALLRKLRQEGMTIISITHRMSEVTESERDIALTDGRAAFGGAPRQLFAHRDWVASLGVELPPVGTLVMRGYIPGTVALTIGAAHWPPEVVAVAVITVAFVATWWQVELRPGRASV